MFHKSIGRTLKNVAALGLFCFFFFLILMIQEVSRQQPSTIYFPWRDQSLSEDGRFLRIQFPYFNSPVEREEIKDGTILMEYHQGRSTTSKVTLLTQPDIIVKYLNRPFTELTFTSRGEHSAWKTYGPQLKSVGDYFRYLRASQTNCYKLKRMGGTYECKKGEGDINNMDGHKYVCMDPELLLMSGSLSRDFRKCLTLSYGVQEDTTFDEAMSNLPCEVHMYDVIDFKPFLPSAAKDRVHFHVEGLANMYRINVYSNINVSAPMDRLRNHVAKSNLTGRLIHVLKVDIENDEWEAFRDIVQDPIFDAVGQVALEVHATELVKESRRLWPKPLPEEQWLEAMQDRYDVIKAIEARGFRRVLYWENVREKNSYIDPDGTIYATSGELLYINTNWYNSSFMNHLALRGYKFLDLT